MAVGFSGAFSLEPKSKCVCVKAALGRLASVFVSDSERRVQRAEQRALKAEEALQLASVRIRDLERKLQGSSGPPADGSESPTCN